MYEIRAKYPGEPWEVIDTADTKKEAYEYLKEYIMAYGIEWMFKIRRVKG